MELHAAAARGDIRGVEDALQAGTSVDARNAQGETALIHALSRAGSFVRRKGPLTSIETIELLLKRGADFTLADDSENTPLNLSVRIANRKFSQLLLAMGANPKKANKSGYSPLVHACHQPPSEEKLEIIRSLVELGADLDMASSYGESPLSVSFFFGDFQAIRLLLDLGANADVLEWTPQHRAVFFGEMEELDRLTLEREVVNATSPRFGFSPWLLSIACGDLQKVKMLAERGGDLTQTGRCEETLLHIAVKHGREEVAQWLLELGADPNAAGYFGEAPLHTACEWNQPAMAKLLLNAGAKIDPLNGVDSQPIHHVRSLETLQILVGAGADVNAIDGCGDWPLKNAAQANDFESVEWMLANGAVVDRTSTGETALHAAVRADAREVMKQLVAAGANPNAPDVDDWTPIFWAQSCEAIRLLKTAGAKAGVTDLADFGAEYWMTDPLLKAELHR